MAEDNYTGRSFSFDRHLFEKTLFPTTVDKRVTGLNWSSKRPAVVVDGIPTASTVRNGDQLGSNAARGTPDCLMMLCRVPRLSSS